jgi:L-lactate utilization protein LutC
VTGQGREHGDRERFLAPARERLRWGVLPNPVHVPPPTPPPGEPAPAPRYLVVDEDDLVGTFVRTLTDTGATCDVVAGGAGDDDSDGRFELPGDLVDRLVTRLDEGPVVASSDPEAVVVARQLRSRGVAVLPATPEAAADARLGLTGAVAGVAATGSVALDSRRAGGRLAALLPPVHLCVLGVNKLVRTPGDVLRGIASGRGVLPPSLVLVTGPSRTGDIEQLITLGAHGPTALHVVLVT